MRSLAPTKLKKKMLSKASENNVEENDAEKRIREIVVNMKCLHIAQSMLENVEGNLQQNAHLMTMLNTLIIPSVRSHEAPIRERGLTCLGLCCLLGKVRLKCMWLSARTNLHFSTDACRRKFDPLYPLFFQRPRCPSSPFGTPPRTERSRGRRYDQRRVAANARVESISAAAACAQ